MAGTGAKELAGLLDGHVQNVGDGLALVGSAQGLGVVAAALADLARHVDVGEEVHLYPDLTVAPARLAAATLHVEGEPAGLVAPYLRLRCRGEELADVVEDLGVGRRVGARGPPYGALVYVYNLVHVLDAAQAACRPGRCLPRLTALARAL
jgi:hypothetical protein